MPALQVRDFPATLYDELKEYAARNHRSIAQQTIIAVEEMLAEASRCGRSPSRSMQIVCHAPRRAMVIFSSLQRGSQREASGRKEGQSRSPERRGVSRFSPISMN